MALIVFYDTTELDKQQLTDALSETDHHWDYVNEKISLQNINPEAEIISVFVGSTVTREMIEAMPKLTLICCRSTGHNNIDLAAAKEKNITVANVPVYGNTTVAEYAFTLLLALTRKLPEVLESEHEPYLTRELTGHDLAGKTFGVIGTGNIGQKSLSIARGFGMKTIAYDVFPKDELESELGFSYVSLEQLLSQADYVSLHVPYNPHTHHLLNRERLSAMKQGAVLVNTARGALVDTRALVELLGNGYLGGAALDVIEGEKLLNYDEELALLASGFTPEDELRHSVEISALKKMPNVIVSPHNAFNTVEAVGRINKTTAENVINFYAGTLTNRVELKDPITGKLVLLRHTESVWNACGVWSGLTDIDLSEKGVSDCAIVGQSLKSLDFPIDTAFHTEQVRTRQTLEGLLEEIDSTSTQVKLEAGFNERNYGEYTGMDKWKVKEELGGEKFNEIRRGWDVPFPNGETLKQVYERVVPAYEKSALPLLRSGKNVLIVAHGNSLRALMKHLNSIPDDKISELEMLMNQMMVYEIEPKTGLKKSVETLDTGTKVEAKF